MRSKLSSRVLSVLLALVLVLSTLSTMAFAAGEKSDDVVILYTNDVHCGVDAGTPEDTMGYANLAAYKHAMEEAHEHVVLVDAGDAIQGEAIGTLSNGSYLVDIMNQVGYDYATFGNHEFDYGMDVALSLLEKSNAKYLSCNFTDLKENKPVADAYAMETFGSLKVAFVGVSTPETFTKSTPTYFQDAEGNYIYGFCEGGNGQDLYNAVQGAVDAAVKEGADVVIALGHCGIDEQSSPWTSREIIANTTGLDAFIDGHSHSTIPGETVKDKSGNDVVLTSTGTKLANIGKMTITAEGQVSTELVNGYTEVDAETDAFVKNIQAQYEDKLNEVVAKSDVDLVVMDPATGNRLIRNQETNLGNLCADAYRTVLGADIAFVNGGGIRADIPAGDITYGQVIAVHPFGNTACVVEATGQEIADALEMTARSTPGENGGFLQVSGLKYTIDLNIASSVKLDDKSMFVAVEGLRRVKNIQVLNQAGEYEPLDLEKTYKLASHNYMLKSGGDGINMFMDNKVLQDEVMIDNQVLITYVRDSLKGVVGDAYANPYGEGRITITDMPYTDVHEGQFFYEPVKFVDGQGYMEGIGDGLFAPNQTLNRAMVATVLYRMAGTPEVTSTSNFSDVVPGSYYENAVAWAAAEGITLGYGDQTFRPLRDISRQEMTTMFYRYAKSAGLDVSKAADLSSFTDGAKASPYAQDAMKWAVAVGLIQGMGDNTLQPLYEADPDLEAALKPYETATWQDYMLQPIGKATGNFSAANLGAAPSAFVDLVNKVQIWGAYDRTGENTPDNEEDDTPAQLSITAPLTSGNAENLIPEGDIVLGDMFKLYRYENWFYQITMSGKEVRTWLEYSASKVQIRDDGTVNIQGGLTYYDVIYGEGFSYVIDPAQPQGSRIVSMTYHGEEVADDAEFTVVINNYRYNGGGDYVKYLNEHGCDFKANDESRIIYSTQYDMIQGEDKGQARNLLADYIREAGEISPSIDSTWSILLPN